MTYTNGTLTYRARRRLCCTYGMSWDDSFRAIAQQAIAAGGNPALAGALACLAAARAVTR